MGVNVILGPGLNIKDEAPSADEISSIFPKIHITREKWQPHIFVESRAWELQPARSILRQTARNFDVWQMTP